MATAHVVVLQILLTGVISSHNITNLGATDPFVICYGGDAGHATPDAPAQHREHHQPCALCALGVMGAAILPETAVAAGPDAARNLAYHLASHDVVVARQLTPRLSQGPPANA
jgi:hypothetical protein